MNDVSPSLAAFVSTVVRALNQLPMLNANGTKLYFLLLGNSPKSFSEDDEKFRRFYDYRYLSLIDLNCGSPHIMMETAQWWNDEVFVQEEDEEEAEVDKEQEAYEAKLARKIARAGKEQRQRREEVLQDLREEALQGENGGA